MYSIMESKKVGKNFILGDFSIVRQCVEIGDDVEIREHCIIGSLPFIFSDKDEKRLTETSGIKIGNNVFISCFANIAMGSKHDTIIEDDVQMNAYAMLGHDVHVHKRVEIMNATIVAGHSIIGENTFLGLGTMVRNRVTIGKNTVIGMGSVVTHDIPDNVIAFGDPCEIQGPNTQLHTLAKKIEKKVQRTAKSLRLMK